MNSEKHNIFWKKDLTWRGQRNKKKKTEPLSQNKMVNIIIKKYVISFFFSSRDGLMGSWYVIWCHFHSYYLLSDALNISVPWVELAVASVLSCDIGMMTETYWPMAFSFNFVKKKQQQQKQRKKKKSNKQSECHERISMVVILWDVCEIVCFHSFIHFRILYV